MRVPQCPTSRPCARDVFTSSPHRGPDRSAVGGCGPVWYVRGDNLQLQTVTDARGAQTPPETVFRARNPPPGAVITALRADTAAGDGVHNLATLATCLFFLIYLCHRRCFVEVASVAKLCKSGDFNRDCRWGAGVGRAGLTHDFWEAKTTFESQNEKVASVAKLCKVTDGSPRERRLQPPARGFGRTAWSAGPGCTRKDRPRHTHTYTTPTGGWTGATRRLAHEARTRPGGVTPTQLMRQRGGACAQDRNRRAPGPQNRVTMYSWESRTDRLELDGPARM